MGRPVSSHRSGILVRARSMEHQARSLPACHHESLFSKRSLPANHLCQTFAGRRNRSHLEYARIPDRLESPLCPGDFSDCRACTKLLPRKTDLSIQNAGSSGDPTRLLMAQTSTFVDRKEIFI